MQQSRLKFLNRVTFYACFSLFAGVLGISLPSYGDSSAETLIIISPHRKSIQQEIIPLFEEYYKKQKSKTIKVEWLDQGGTADDVRFIKSKYAKNDKTSGIDVFWGGGAAAYVDLQQLGYLQPIVLDEMSKSLIPKQAAGVDLIGKDSTWVATAISSFGLFYNRMLCKLEGVAEPKLWKDLADPQYIDKVVLADPRRSGSATTMNTIILKSQGWTKAWELFTALSGNSKKFTHSSSDPIKSVVAGDAAATMAIDFYASAKIGDLGEKNLGFTLPKGQTIIDPDPVAILKGAPNAANAQVFANFLLTTPIQSLLMLPKGAKGGPKNSTLGRMAVTQAAYDATEGKRIVEDNPLKGESSIELEFSEAAEIRQIFSDLMGAMIIDNHRELRKAWELIVKNKTHEKMLSKLSKLPIDEKTFYEYAKKWDDKVFRNKQINEWVKFARKKYQEIIDANGKPT